MPDPKLVAYLRKTVPEYGADAVRDKLLEEGLSAPEIDDALAIAIKPSARKPPLAMFAVLGLIAVAAVAAFLAMEKPRPGSTSAPSGPDPVEAPAQPPGTPGAHPDGGGAGGPHMGHYGYLLQAPAGYATQTQFKDMNRTEVVFVYPEKTDPTNFGNEGLYGQLGIMRLEVSPLRIPQGIVDLGSLKQGVLAHLTNRGDAFDLKDVNIGGLRGFVVTISQPVPLVQAFIVGTKVMYILTSGTDEQKFRDTLNSLTEVSPHDNPVDQ